MRGLRYSSGVLSIHVPLFSCLVAKLLDGYNNKVSFKRRNVIG